LEKQM